MVLASGRERTRRFQWGMTDYFWLHRFYRSCFEVPLCAYPSNHFWIFVDLEWQRDLRCRLFLDVYLLSDWLSEQRSQDAFTVLFAFKG